ncbi:unnamed protein product [Meganyctiphanes norvegica]|uniref:Glycine N-acyltransferase-like protein n=1 Tax=Meganyctiphanes norvegica TaxID=48144 RepID=A0AAV2S8D1_MEGNR
MDEEDVFQRETNLLQLADKIGKDIPKPCSIYNQLILNARGLCTYMNFYVLSKSPESHIVISINKDNEEDIEMHCLKEEVNTLVEALGCTHLINWKKDITFYHIYDHFIPGIKKLIETKSGTKLEPNLCYIYIYKDNTNLSLSCPQGFDVKLLGKRAIREMFDTWDYSHLSNFDGINRLASAGLACGVYLCPTSESKTLNLNDVTTGSDEEVPIAWMTTCSYGGLGILKTVEKYRKRGLGTLIAQSCAKVVKNKGYIPHSFVQYDNSVSKSFFDKMHWEQLPCASFKYKI